MRLQKILYTMQRAKVHRKAADTWLVCVRPAAKYRNVRQSNVCGSYSIQIGRTVSFPTPTALVPHFFSPSLSPPFFLFVRSISFSPSDRKQIRDTAAAAQQRVVRFACRVFRVTRGNRHGNLIFTEKLITHRRLACTAHRPRHTPSKARKAGGHYRVATSVRKKRKKRRLWKLCRTLWLEIGQKAPPHTSFYCSYDFERNIFNCCEVRLLFSRLE